MADWTNIVDGNWTDAARWTGSVPSSAGSAANFLAASAGAATANIDVLGSTISVGSIRVVTDANDRYRIFSSTGTGILRFFATSGSPATLTVDSENPSGFEIAAQINLQSDLIIDTKLNSRAVFSNAIVSGSEIYKFGVGTLVLSGVSTTSFVGELFVNAGRVEFTQAAALGSVKINLKNSGEFVSTGGNVTINNEIESGSKFDTGRVAASAGDTLTIAGILSSRTQSTGGFRLGGSVDSGTIILAGFAGDFNGGGFTLSGGIVRFGTANAAATMLAQPIGSGVVRVNPGATLDLAGFAATIGNLDLGGGIVRSSTGALRLTINDTSFNVISQSGAIEGTAQADSVIVNVSNNFAFSQSADFNNWNSSLDAITINGSFLNNQLTGSLQNDSINGGGGDDVLTGGGGVDVLAGGTGNDTYNLFDLLGTLVENANEGFDTVAVGANIGVFTLATNFENLTFTSPIAHVGFGNAASNVITGNIGSDQLAGLDGDDVLIGGSTTAGQEDALVGGLGNDIFVVALRGTTIVEASGEGIDEVRAISSVFVLPNQVENLSFATSSANHVGFGNALDNVITGGTGSDGLVGDAGNDTIGGGTGAGNELIGGTGNDTYVVQVAGDTIIEFTGEGTDTVSTALANYTLRLNVENLTYTGTAAFGGVGTTENNAITGGSGADTLVGDGGNDILTGRSGADLLIGGTGADQFRYNGGETGFDRITDFTSGTDKITLSGSGFTQTGALTYQAGAGVTATTANSTFLYDTNTGIVSYDADGSGAGAAVQLAQLNLGLTLTVGDFIFF